MIPAYTPPEKAQEGILAFYRQCYNLLNQQWNIRERLLQADRSYMREKNLTDEHWKARQANKRGNPNKFQDIEMPVVMPQIEAAVSYQLSTFLTGYPIFGVVSYPEFADAAMMMDTIIGEQQIYAKWVPELIKVIRNGFKYNLAACEVDWCKEVTATVTTDVTLGASGKPEETIWAGNKIKALDMYNTFWDTRCSPMDVSKWGEFAGYTELMSRIRLKQFIAGLPTKINVKEAFESGYSAPVAFGSAGVETFYMPNINPESYLDLSTQASTDWMAWAGVAGTDSKILYKNMYEVTTLYGRILPSDFGMKGVPGQNTPQIWKFIIVNNQVIIYAERMTNAHNLIPVLFCQPLEDGLAYQTKSFLQNVEPIQEITTALANSSIAARRRAISDRVLYDPSRVSAAALNNDSPSAKIPVRPSAYQDDLSKAVYAFPFRDDQFQINAQEIQFFMGLANQISGLNPARQGQFVKGNKTRHEFAEIMQYANGRDQAIAMTLEANFFAPMKEIIKYNILQYQGGVTLYNREAQQEVAIDPLVLRKANLAFKVSDGLLPSEKLIDGESLAMGFQTIAASPQLAQGYNLTQLFSYLMKSRGARLQPFEKSQEQLAYEQALATWQQGMAQMGEAMKGLEPGQMQDMMNQAMESHPMPKPEDYGYTPGKPQMSQSNPLNTQAPSIMGILNNVVSSSTQQQQAAAPGGGEQGTQQ